MQTTAALAYFVCLPCKLTMSKSEVGLVQVICEMFLVHRLSCAYFEDLDDIFHGNGHHITI